MSAGLCLKGGSSPFWGPFIHRQYDLFILYIMTMECVSGAWIRMSLRVLPQRLAAVDGHNEEKHGPQKAQSRRILDGKWRHIEAWGILTLAAGLLITLLLHASVERHDTLLRMECLMKPCSHYSAHHSSMYYSWSSDAWNRWCCCFFLFSCLVSSVKQDAFIWSNII